MKIKLKHYFSCWFVLPSRVGRRIHCNDQKSYMVDDYGK